MRFFFFFFFLFPLLNACNAITVPVIKSVDSVQINSIEGNLVSLKAYLSIENTNQFTLKPSGELDSGHETNPLERS